MYMIFRKDYIFLSEKTKIYSKISKKKIMCNRFYHPFFTVFIYVHNSVKKNHQIGPGRLGAFLVISIQSICVVRIKKKRIRKKKKNPL